MQKLISIFAICVIAMFLSSCGKSDKIGYDSKPASEWSSSDISGALAGLEGYVKELSDFNQKDGYTDPSKKDELAKELSILWNKITIVSDGLELNKSKLTAEQLQQLEEIKPLLDRKLFNQTLVSMGKPEAKPQTFDEFWLDFQSAVVAKDKNRVAEMIDFPFVDPFDGVNLLKPAFTVGNDFDKFFTKSVIAKIKKTKASDFNFDEADAGRGIAEDEHSIFLGGDEGGASFIFALRDGQYKLIRIDLIG